MSTQERLFKTLVSKLICKKVPVSEEREQRLLTFYNQAEFQYDIFCESIHTLMSTNNIHTISLDDLGYTRFDSVDSNNLIGHAILSKEDVVSPNDDIIVYVDLALNRLKSRLDTTEELAIQLQRHPGYKKIKLS